MSVEPAFLEQILVAWRETRWTVARNTAEVGAYAYRTHAMDRARTLSHEIIAEGHDCYILIREKDGAWIERPCPQPRRGA